MYVRCKVCSPLVCLFTNLALRKKTMFVAMPTRKHQQEVRLPGFYIIYRSWMKFLLYPHQQNISTNVNTRNDGAHRQMSETERTQASCSERKQPDGRSYNRSRQCWRHSDDYQHTNGSEVKVYLHRGLETSMCWTWISIRWKVDSP